MVLVVVLLLIWWQSWQSCASCLSLSLSSPPPPLHLYHRNTNTHTYTQVKNGLWIYSHIWCSVGGPTGNSMGYWCAGLKVSYWDITRLQHFEFLIYVEPIRSSTSIQFTKKSETTRWLLRRWRDVRKIQRRGSLCTECSAGTRAVQVKRRWVMQLLESAFPLVKQLKAVNWRR